MNRQMQKNEYYFEQFIFTATILAHTQTNILLIISRSFYF